MADRRFGEGIGGVREFSNRVVDFLQGGESNDVDESALLTISNAFRQTVVVVNEKRTFVSIRSASQTDDGGVSLEIIDGVAN